MVFGKLCVIALIFASFLALPVHAVEKLRLPALTSALQPASDPAAVVRKGPAWRYPQSGWIVLHIEGTPYERGYQHGHLLAREIADYIKTLATDRSPQSPETAWKDFRLFSQAFFLQRFDSEWREEMKGIADGAAAAGAKFDDRRLDLMDIVALNADVEISFLEEALKATSTGLDALKFSTPQYSLPKTHKPERCSAFVATKPATRNGQIVAGHITMSSIPFVRHYNIWLDLQPAKGHRVVFQTFPGGIQSGLDYYLCDSGLIITETTIAQTAFNADGESIASRIRRAVQYADSIDDCVRILTKSNNGLYTNEWLFADTKTNEIAMFELGTKNTRLWRSSRNEWPGETAGFYWGCNNAKDRTVLLDTVADMKGKPANLILRPERRDLAWQKIFQAHHGMIDESFGVEAFSTPPLAAFPSCDAKVTTAALAKDLKSWALFGPPLGHTWEPTREEIKHNDTLQPLVSNDWTLLSPQAPPAQPHQKQTLKIADIKPFADDDDDLSLTFDQRHPFAWRGTFLPQSDADIWLAAAFAEYERIVSFEKALLQEADDHKLSPDAADLVETALFTRESEWYAAARRYGKNVALTDTQPNMNRDDWYPMAVGQGVCLLAELRKKIGADRFDVLLDEFGVAHAGQAVATSDFRRFLENAAGKAVAEIFARWLDNKSTTDTNNQFPTPAWSIYSFEEEPQRTLIVYGTAGDVSAQREAATLLQKATARRFNNSTIPIKADHEVTDDERKSNHLLLVGRPLTNPLAAQTASTLPLSFSNQSFILREETYANADTAIIVAGENPWNRRYSAVIFAGLGARATRECVQKLSPDEVLSPQILLFPARRTSKMIRVPIVTSPTTANRR